MNISDSIPEEENYSLPYLLFSVGKNIYAISSVFVHSIERLGEIVSVSESDPSIRGGTLYQNNFIYLIDMRTLFGMDSQIGEFEKTVKPEQRIKDHENWVAALEKSVQEHSEFLLTDDPHKCAFGKWYYGFKTENNVLKHQLGAIEAPHEAIHNTAKLVRELMKNGDYESAGAVVKKMQSTHFKTTLEILSSLREIMADSLNELFIVIDSCDCIKGLIVDSIVGVEYLGDTLQIPQSMQGRKYIKCLGRRKDGDSLVIVLNNSI